MVTVHPYKANPNYKHSQMTCRAYIQLPLYVDGINYSIDTQMMKTPYILLLRLKDLDNGRKLYIVTLKKYRGDIFSEWCSESFKAKFLRYVNEGLFES